MRGLSGQMHILYTHFPPRVNVRVYIASYWSQLCNLTHTHTHTQGLHNAVGRVMKDFSRPASIGSGMSGCEQLSTPTSQFLLKCKVFHVRGFVKDTRKK